MLAEYLDLSAATVSYVLNDSPNRQPLQQMGSVATSLLLKKIDHGKVPDGFRVDPQLIARESNAKVRSGA